MSSFDITETSVPIAAEDKYLIFSFGTGSSLCPHPASCLRGVDSGLKRSSEFITIDEQSKHEIVHVFRLGEAQRATHEPLDPRPQINVFALDFLCVLLAYLMLLGIEMPLVSPPAVGIKTGDAKRGQERFELEKDVVLTPPEHIRQDLPRVVVNGMPQPARIGFAAHVTPHFVQL